MKMTITKEKAREVANTVNANRESRAQKDAENYITAVLESVISRAAEQGGESLTFHIPSVIEDNLVLAILRENGFTVEDARVIHSYKISW
jgi:hypothetical protein